MWEPRTEDLDLSKRALLQRLGSKTQERDRVGLGPRGPDSSPGPSLLCSSQGKQSLVLPEPQCAHLGSGIMPALPVAGAGAAVRADTDTRRFLAALVGNAGCYMGTVQPQL